MKKSMVYWIGLILNVLAIWIMSMGFIHHFLDTHKWHDYRNRHNPHGGSGNSLINRPIHDEGG